MSQNRISHSLTDEARADIRTSVQALRDKLDFLIDLTPDEKNSMVRAGSRNIQFAELMSEIASRQPNMIPDAVNLDELKQDLALYHDLRLLQMDLDPLLELINDTKIAAGSDAYSASLTLYGIAQALQLEGTEEAKRQMSSHFSKSSRKTPVAPGDEATLSEEAGAGDVQTEPATNEASPV